jgi:hypothetical protein
MHFEIISPNDLALLIESSTITRRLSAKVDAFEAAHPIIGRLLVTVDAISGTATVASERPVSDHLITLGQAA